MREPLQPNPRPPPPFPSLLPFHSRSQNHIQRFDSVPTLEDDTLPSSTTTPPPLSSRPKIHFLMRTKGSHVEAKRVSRSAHGRLDDPTMSSPHGCDSHSGASSWQDSLVYAETSIAIDNIFVSTWGDLKSLHLQFPTSTTRPSASIARFPQYLHCLAFKSSMPFTVPWLRGVLSFAPAFACNQALVVFSPIIRFICSANASLASQSPES